MVQCDPVAMIDLVDFEARKEEITKQLMAAASDIGFFRVKGLLASCFLVHRGSQALHNSL